MLHVLETLHTSFMYKINNDGPNTEPWGIPQVTCVELT